MSPEVEKKWDFYEAKPPLNEITDKITTHPRKHIVRDCHLILDGN